MNATQLAARCCILRPSMTLIARALQGRKLISRKRDPRDARRLVLAPTAAALALMQKAAPGSNAIHKGLEKGLGRERLADLLDVLAGLSRI